MNLKTIQNKLKSNTINILMLSLIIGMMGIGSCATVNRVTLQGHTICTSTGQRLMWVRPNLGRQTEYSITFGKPVRRTIGVTECATSRIDGLALASWHHQKLLMWLRRQETRGSVYYRKRVLMRKKCLPTRLYRSR